MRLAPITNRFGLTSEDREHYETHGYVKVRNVISHDAAVEVRGVIRDCILKPEPDAPADQDPMDPMGDSPAARAARYRKLPNFCIQSPVILENVHCSDQVLSLATSFLGGDLLLKFAAIFLKPAKTGAATPWHQDNGLWRDGDRKSFNFWTAIDPASKANGCIQFLPGSHLGVVIDHVRYDDSVHPELPREEVPGLIDRFGVDHAELGTGDLVIWHSSMMHYSPPNLSLAGRIGVAGVITTPDIVRRHPWHWQDPHWLLKGGQKVDMFPLPAYKGKLQRVNLPPHKHVGTLARPT